MMAHRRLSLGEWFDEVVDADLAPLRGGRIEMTRSRAGSAKAAKPAAGSAAVASSSEAAKTYDSTPRLRRRSEHLA